MASRHHQQRQQYQSNNNPNTSNVGPGGHSQGGGRPFKICMVGAPSSGKSCLVNRLQYNEFKEDLVTVGVSFVPYTIAISKTTLAKSQYGTYLTRFFHNPDHKPLYPPAPQPTQQQRSVTTSTSITVISDPTNQETKHVTLNCWDTCGAERYSILTKKYYQGCDACIACYDLTDEESFTKLRHWVEQVQSVEPDTLIVIVGNKKDLITPIAANVQKKYPDYIFDSIPQPRAVPLDQVREFALEVGAVCFEGSAKLNEDLSNCDTVFEIFNFIAHEVAYRQAHSVKKDGSNPNSISLDQKPDKEPSSCC